MKKHLLRALLFAFALCAPVAALAQQGVVPTDPITGNKAHVVGNALQVNCTVGCSGGSGSNASVGTNGVAAPSSSTQIGIRDGSGNLQPASSANPVPVSTASQTPAALANSAVATGGTAVTIVSGGSSGGYVYNPPTAAGQGLSVAENMYVDYVDTPGSTDATCNNTCTIVPPDHTWGWGVLNSGVTIKVNAASSGHTFSGAK